MTMTCTKGGKKREEKSRLLCYWGSKVQAFIFGFFEREVWTWELQVLVAVVMLPSTFFVSDGCKEKLVFMVAILRKVQWAE